MAAIRAGIVGAGFVGRIHARSARAAGARIVGAAGSTPEGASAAAEALGAERGYVSGEELAAAGEIDVLHICTPNHLHVPLALAALEAGKQVVCEKPVALDTAEARELEAGAADAGALVAVPFVYRFYPTVREARERLRGEAGALRLIHGAYLQDWLVGEEDYNWRVDPALGGRSRAFADIGSHWCDLAEFVTGERIARLAARTAVANPRRRRSGSPSFVAGGGDGEMVEVATEDTAGVMFETDRGTPGSLVVSQVSAGHKNHLWIDVTTGAETIGFDQERPDRLLVRGARSTEVVPRDLDTLSPAAAPYVVLPGGHPQGYLECFDAFVADVYAAVAGAEPPPGLPLLADGVRAVELTDAVLAAARSGTWVELG